MLLTILAGMALSPQNVPDSCRDDDGQDRCAPAKQAEMRALYGVAPIEKFAADKSQVRRVFYVDGYGNDVVAIEFVRAAGQDATVKVHHPGDPVMESKLSEGAWTDLIRRSAFFDRSFESVRQAAKKKSADDEMVICLHSWVYWVEGTGTGEKTRSRVDDACNDSPTEEFAWEAARSAVAAIPYCAALDRQFHRNEATLLGSCSSLRGDRLAAARVFNEAKGFRALDDRDSGIAPFADYRVSLDWDGKVSTGDAAKTFWMSKLKENDQLNYFFDQVEGLTAENVLVKGNLYRHADGPTEIDEVAHVEMMWEAAGPDVQIRSINVGPFRPLQPGTSE